MYVWRGKFSRFVRPDENFQITRTKVFWISGSCEHREGHSRTRAKQRHAFADLKTSANGRPDLKVQTKRLSSERARRRASQNSVCPAISAQTLKRAPIYWYRPRSHFGRSHPIWNGRTLVGHNRLGTAGLTDGVDCRDRGWYGARCARKRCSAPEVHSNRDPDRIHRSRVTACQSGDRQATFWWVLE